VNACSVVFALVVTLASCLTNTLAIASVALAFEVDEIQGDGWLAQGIGVRLQEPVPGQPSISLKLGQLELPADRGRVTDLEFTCPVEPRPDGGWNCVAGRLRVADSPLRRQDAAWSGHYAAQDGLAFQIPRLAVGSGYIALALTWRDGEWDLRVSPKRVALARLLDLSPALALPKGWQFGGQVSGVLRLSGATEGRAEVEANLRFDELGYASSDATQAAEKVALVVDLRARRARTGWVFEAALDWPRGALYSEPLYLDAAQGALTARIAGQWRPAQHLITLDAATLQLADTAEFSASGRLQVAPPMIQGLEVALRSEHAGRLYQRLLQPLLIGSAVDDLEVAGIVDLKLQADEDGIEQASLDIQGLRLQDRQGRFGLAHTDGSVAWQRDGEAQDSRLEISGASLYRIPTGAFRIETAFVGDRIELLQPLVVPVLGGEVALQSFAMRGVLVADTGVEWQAGVWLREVDLEQLTRLLDWPPFGGALSGRLDDMRYADRSFSIGGGLQLSAFDGDIRVTGLQVRDPFGSVPILEAAAVLRGLNLEALTRTFSFGLIEGRLDGALDGLRLVGWLPTHFDLRLYTPDGDDSRRRISQRAVENLTELGSGVPAGLSSTVLRIFDRFNYERIDLGVALRGEVAQIEGLARPDGGYYLVKGAGLPRIDVIGRNRRVAWRDLIERLRQIQLEEARIE